MEYETYQALSRPIRASNEEQGLWRRDCGCLRTSDKLREILKSFPSPPPPFPTPAHTPKLDTSCISPYCRNGVNSPSTRASEDCEPTDAHNKLMQAAEPDKFANCWRRLSGELVQVIQMSVTATALVFYYLIFCYMQIIYFTLKSVMYFHRADGPMKITLAVVTLSSMFLLYNVIMRLELLFYERNSIC